MHRRLCINCYATDYWGEGGYSKPTPPSTHTNSLANSVTFNAKTTVHCSPDSSMARPHPFQQQASGQIFKDDVNGFPSISDICFMRNLCSYMPVVKGY